MAGLKRIARFLFIAAVAASALVSLALWLFFSSWLPRSGKALLIQELERQGPISAQIEAIRYQPFRGFTLQEIVIADRRSSAVWLSASSLQLRVNWLSLIFRRKIAFYASGALSAPCQTDLILVGRYSLGTRALDLEARTDVFPLQNLSRLLQQHLPPPLSDGSLRLVLRLKAKPDLPLEVSGEIRAGDLTWNQEAFQLRADLVIEGQATAPPRKDLPWSIQALMRLSDGSAKGLPIVDATRSVQGTARLSGDQLIIEELSGALADGSRWRAEGRIAPLARPSLELMLASTLDAALLTASTDAWKLSGPAQTRAVCRGPLKSLPRLDCLASASLQGLTLTGARLKEPITQLTGNLAYDAVEQKVSIAHLEGRLLDHVLKARGEVAFAPPAALSLDIAGALPLESLQEWLPKESPLSQVSGLASVDLRLKGPLATPRALGRIDLAKAAIRLASLPDIAIDEISGAVFLQEDLINPRNVSLRLSGQPLRLTATWTLGESPGLIASVDLPRGHLEMRGRLAPQEIVVEKALLSLARSRLEAKGRIARNPDEPSTLNLSGELDLAELDALPFLSLPALSAWELQGLMEGQIAFRGPLRDWQAATIYAQLRSGQLSVRQIPINQLVCTIEQSSGGLRARIPSALVAEGKWTMELIVRHGAGTHDYLLEADLIGLQLEKLSKAIPAWRSRSITGSASAHAVASGTWERHNTWRGEGWINASGERLGDLPLLDKLFRGLFGTLADRLGLETLRRAQITHASTQWRLAQERFHTEDLRLSGMAGNEPVAVYARGSVGLDRTLDFVVEPELSEGVVLEAPTTSTLAQAVLKAAGGLERLRRLIGRHRLTGTLENPTYRFELSTQEIFKQLAPGPVDLLQNLLNAVR